MNVEKTEQEVRKEKEKLKSWVKSLLPDEWHKFNLDAHYDSNLNYAENKVNIREQLKVFLQNDIDDTNDTSATVRVNSKKDHYKGIKRAIGKICDGYSNLAFIKGPGGFGKSYNIRRTLKDNRMEFKEVAGDVTEAYLYQLLYEHNGKVIWFKDVSTVLKSVKNINLLKSATETDSKRLITKNNYSKQQEELPDQFCFTGSIIFDYNVVTGSLKKDFEALTTRGDYVDVSLSPKDIKEIMQNIADTDEKKEVTDFLINNCDLSVLNLRTQKKAVDTKRWAEKNGYNWKEEVRNELNNNVSSIKKMLYALVGDEPVRTKVLKKALVKQGMVNTMRTAERRINEWLEMDEIHRLSNEHRNYLVGLYPPQFYGDEDV